MIPPPAVEHRQSTTRRKIDIERLAILGGLVGLLLSAGVAWGAANAAVAQKVDRTEFLAHVADAARRFQGDSIRGAISSDAMMRIERKLDSTNSRLSRLICRNQPSYCQ